MTYEVRRSKAGHLSHSDIACIVKVTTTEGTEIRDVLIGIIYGAEVRRRDHLVNVTPTPDGPNLLVAFQNTAPTYPLRDETSRYFQVNAGSIAIIYGEESPSNAA